MPRVFDGSQMSIRVLTLTGVRWFLTGPGRLRCTKQFARCLRPRASPQSFSSARKPILRFGDLFGPSRRSRIEANMTLNCASWRAYWCSKASRRRAKSAFQVAISRRRSNTSTINKLIPIARLLFKTEDGMTTPCSVNTRGAYLVPPSALF